jgi:hypothetical protein
MDPSSIPKQYGGELDWQWGDMPNLDAPAREIVGALETAPVEGQTKPSFIKGPVLFKGDHVEIIGKENGKSRQTTVPVPTSKIAQPAAQLSEAEKTEETKTPAAESTTTATEELPTPIIEEKTIENGTTASPPTQTVSA